MVIEGYMCDHCAYPILVKVHGVYICSCNATNAIDDDVVFVEGAGVE